MKQLINGVAYHYEWLAPFVQTQPTLVCLHGFTGTGETFRFLADDKKDTELLQVAPSYNYLLVDIIGHGQSSVYVHPYHYQFKQVLHDLEQLLDRLALQRVSLLGYSMGARLALGLTIQIPSRIEHLILESGSPGLRTEEERKVRQMSDQRLAGRLMNQPLADFVDFWQDIPLFNTQKQLSLDVQQAVRSERLSQQNFGLACSLQYMGTGRQPSYWEALSNLYEPNIHVIVGALDSKFGKMANEMKHIQPQLQVTTVADTGHCVHLERPKVFKKIIRQLLQEGPHEN
ncbi:2-succinyl-6-hydroxy-2,4-cyclohexadiene-1-carboxylate synthase [Vagococcus xieshaowenii]|uniref:Putative 2-succinyl-6-hydroxy-2,4-cyclohexadiene-1-carboxylate synthase n=1 Tax=Vagococcus xieshaowenii TaxID=2562451 RepID=A0AAJ5EG18_9ENTE|nr:2-succinyl-6-hydroxy-2,4-cyclohexadiene-1-carboxylate synthase [Vagococcus xieshaowenii]QCA28207.1 2-succinyl-6-hydroxy-2,4-cyclohexadiene-1-carboxylate synthase [Vagococcus xieshaowenii]TFZ42559.1 2-succinyl-6-hydroxy-2,4-cyclohexadiene-1-carboxylate synthase [Vagococcus xieshaowenii]